MSAVIDRKAFDRISGYIDHAKSSPNCSIVAGGGYDDSVGYFVEPTIVQTTTPTDRIFQEEIFGPVVTVYVYPDKVIVGVNFQYSHIHLSGLPKYLGICDYSLTILSYRGSLLQ